MRARLVDAIAAALHKSHGGEHAGVSLGARIVLDLVTVDAVAIMAEAKEKCNALDAAEAGETATE